MGGAGVSARANLVHVDKRKSGEISCDGRSSNKLRCVRAPHFFGRGGTRTVQIKLAELVRLSKERLAVENIGMTRAWVPANDAKLIGVAITSRLPPLCT